MKTPDKPVRPAFDKAADAREAWRRLQLARLTDEQKRAFQRLQFEHNKALRAFSQDFYDHEVERIDEAKRKLLLDKPDLALRMLPLQRMKEARAEQLARGMVHRQHDAERATMEQDHQEIQDRFLEAVEQQRAQQQQEAEKDSDKELRAALEERVAAKARQRGDDGRRRDR